VSPVLFLATPIEVGSWCGLARVRRGGEGRGDEMRARMRERMRARVGEVRFN